jgi:hypothetical protein
MDGTNPLYFVQGMSVAVEKSPEPSAEARILLQDMMDGLRKSTP